MAFNLENPEEKDPKLKYFVIGDKSAFYAIYPCDMYVYKNSDHQCISIFYKKFWYKNGDIRTREHVTGHIRYNIYENDIIVRSNDRYRFYRKPKYYQKLLDVHASEIFETMYINVCKFLEEQKFITDAHKHYVIAKEFIEGHFYGSDTST